MQQCAAGLIEVRREGDRLAFAAPPLRRSGPLEEADVVRIVHALGVRRADVLGHTWADNGPGWRVVELGSAEQVLALRPDLAAVQDLKIGVMGRYPGVGPLHGGPLYEVRAFVPGFVEDPVTGSLNAGIAQWLVARGGMPAYWEASQGTVLGREGRIVVDLEEDGTLWIGGDTVPTIEGTILA